jgi:hypothetical protein
LGLRYTGMTDPRKAMVIKEGVGNIHCPVNNYFVSKTGARINPRYAGVTTGAVIQHGRFNAPNLRSV